MTLIKKVTSALRDSDLDCSVWGTDVITELATIAMKAMKDPSDEMFCIFLDHGWDAMIDAALKGDV